MVISVHPDDETLGCGGTLLKHKQDGDSINCMYVTNGNNFQKKAIAKLDKMYGFEHSFQLGLPEIVLDDISLAEIIPKMSKVINEIKPDIIYLPNRSDPHSDHRRTFEASVATTKSFRYPFVKKIMMCEVISETDFAPALPENTFIPNVFVDVSEFFEEKMKIMEIFESELLDAPFTRSMDSIRAYNRYRGSQINVEYAEVFMLIKEIL